MKATFQFCVSIIPYFLLEDSRGIPIFFFGFSNFLVLLFGRLIIPAINAQLATVRHGIFKLAAVDRATVRSKLATEVGVEILTGLIEGRDVAVPTAPLAVGLGVVGVKVVASGEGTVTARNPANVRLFLGVALHVSLEMLLALEPPLAARLLALELHLLDD
jgi:hypothetical protein